MKPRNVACFPALACLFLTSLLYAAEITTDTVIEDGDPTYDGQAITVNDCKVTVHGNHAFAGVTVIGTGGILEFTGDQLDVASLDVQTEADVVLGGGATLRVTGTLDIAANARLIVQSSDRDAQVDGKWVGRGGTIEAATIAVDLDGKITADGQGYLGSSDPASPAAGPGGGPQYGGGGHGGIGGRSSSGTYYGGGAYGDFLEPVDLGSGGGGGETSTHVGGNGGGAVTIVAQSLTVDGAITAKGTTGTNGAANGAGGSIWINTQSLAGTGMISADGSVEGGYGWGGAGGGGRVAVYYTDTISLPGANITAAGGNGWPDHSDGGAGSVILAKQTGDQLDLYCYATLPIPENTILEARTLLIDGGTAWLGGGGTFRITDNLDMTGGGKIVVQGRARDLLVHGEWVGAGGTIEAATLTMAEGTSISADGQGYLGSSDPATPGAGPGGGPNYGGGGHGGAGGRSHSGTYPGGTTNGDFREPVDLGSGGGAGETGADVGGIGGGAVRIEIDTLALNGTISANGLAGTSHGGGGAGGSVWVTTGTLEGTGTITANGGDEGGNGGAGGGGRVAVYYMDSLSLPGANIAANGGNGYPNHSDGENGTVFIARRTGDNIDLHCYTTFIIPTDEALEAQSLTVHSGTAILGGGARLRLSGPLTIRDGAKLRVDCTDLDPVGGRSGDGAWQGRGGTIEAEHVLIEAGGSLTASSRGYRGNENAPGDGPGGGDPRGGGGHGGMGGHVNGGDAYGAGLGPVCPGSAGGSDRNDSYGGRGGGAIRLIADSLTVDGEIEADGQEVLFYAGGGAGGSIWITVTDIGGSGAIHANGGETGVNAGGGGGSGGRIVIEYSGTMSLPGEDITANAGYGPWLAEAEPGTVIVTDTAGGRRHVHFYTSFATGEDEVLEADAVTLHGGTTRLGGGGRLDVAGPVEILAGATLVVECAGVDGRVEGRWMARGGRLVADTVTVAEGATISADSQGYRGLAGDRGNGPGGGPINSGGGYGGLGGMTSGGNRGRTYGSDMAPLQPGAAGGGSIDGGVGGAGGGAIWITCETLQLDGSITANGQYTTGGGAWRGAGSGGAILIDSATFSGGGGIQANGGRSNQNSGGGGGGGGRVAIHTRNPLQFPLENISVNGEYGLWSYTDAEDGTIATNSDPYPLWVGDESGWCHDTEIISWSILAADRAAYHVALAAWGSGGEVPLADGLSGEADWIWETTTLPDGIYELRAEFGEARAATAISRFVSVLNAVEWHAGSIGADEVWGGDGTVHVVEGELVLEQGVRVGLEAGAIVKFAGDYAVVLSDGSTFSADGTETAPVVLTSITDDTAGGDTNMDGGVTNPGSSVWGGIKTLGTGAAEFNEFVELRNLRIPHNGAITDSETWQADYVHEVTGHVIIGDDATLTVEPGAVIKFGDNARITVGSGTTLEARGTTAQPIHLTSTRDDSILGDTNRDGNASIPAPGDWQGIQVDGGIANIDHAVFSYCAGTHDGTWNENAAAVVVRNGGEAILVGSTIRDVFFEGVICWNDASVHATNCLILGADRGVNVDGTVALTNCTLDGNRVGIWAHGGNLEMVNTIVSNGIDSGIDCVLTTDLDIRYCNVWSEYATRDYQNYARCPDLTGTDGNISLPPSYVDASRSDYRLDYLSPMIDAADGDLAPVTDARGRPRYDDPRTANSGNPNPGGQYPDIGAYEFVESAPSDLDLRVSQIIGPTLATVGKMVEIRWHVTNAGTVQARGPWRDAVALVGPTTREGATVPIPAGDYTTAVGTVLGPGQSLEVTASVRVPGLIEGQYEWQVTTNARGDLFEGANALNNTTVASSPVDVSIDQLPVDGDALAGLFTGPGQSHWFRFAGIAGEDMVVTLDTDSTEGIVEVYVGKGYIPTREAYDRRHIQNYSPDVTVSIPDADSVDYYVTTYARAVPESTAFQIGVQTSAFGLHAVDQEVVGNAGWTTLGLTGAKLEEGFTYELVSPSGEAIAAEVVAVLDSTSVKAGFDLTGAEPGVWAARVTDAGGATQSLEAAFTVTEGGGARLWAEVEGRDLIRIKRDNQYVIHYGNSGTNDANGLLIVAIKGVPSGTTIQPGPSFTPPPLPEGIDVQRPSFVVCPEGVVLAPLVIQAMPPGAREKVAFSMNVPGQSDFTVEANIMDLGALAVVCPGCIPPARGGDEVIDDLLARALATVIGIETWNDNNIVTRLWRGDQPGQGAAGQGACTGAAVTLALALKEATQNPLSDLYRWKVRVVEKPTHTAVMISSPDLTRHYVVDNYLVPTTFRVNERSENGETVWRTDALAWASFFYDPAVFYDLYVHSAFAWQISPYDDIINPPRKEGTTAPVERNESSQMPPRCGVCDVVAELEGTAGSSIDPNEKTGPEGAGELHFVADGHLFAYTIFFENLPAADFPAQIVVVEDYLDASLDWSTLELVQVAFNDAVVEIPAGHQEYRTQTTVSTDPNPVDIDIRFDTDTGLLSWRLTSVDPRTGRLPDDPLAGFLPPNDDAGVGEGHVGFTVRAKTGLATGKEISNQAKIVFDENNEIVTNLVENTVDAEAPVSSFSVEKAGDGDDLLLLLSADDGVGSGVALFDIFVSLNGEAAALWHSAAETVVQLLGGWDTVFEFFVRGRDKVGNAEPIPRDNGTILRTPQWAMAFGASETEVANLYAGVHPDATLFWDEGLDEESATGPPRRDVGTCAFVGPPGHGALRYDVRAPSPTIDWWLEATPGEEPIILSWDPGTVPDGVQMWLARHDELANEPMGETFVDLAKSGQMTISEAGRYLLRYTTEVMTQVIPLSDGWNLVGLPLSPQDSAAAAVFGGRAVRLPVWTFASTIRDEKAYVRATDTGAGAGYWVLAPEGYDLLVAGQPFGRESVTLDNGWNLIAVTGPGRLPIDENLRGAAWQFVAGQGGFYFQTRDLVPGLAYWVYWEGPDGSPLDLLPAP